MINLKPIKGYLDKIEIIDQRLLPIHKEYITLKTVEDLANAIKTLAVRGAPAIGIAASYGLCLGIKDSNREKIKNDFYNSYEILKNTRPTAVNLFTCLNRMKNKFEEIIEKYEINQIKEILFKEAIKIEEEDYIMCRKIGENGYKLIENLDNINAMTICNAGGLATSGFGTALGVFYMAKEKGKKIKVFVPETRPLLQGARLTTYELSEAQIDVVLLTDNMAGFLMKKEKIDIIVVGADRITKNGDTANKIGTYTLAILAKYHNIPFYVAAPSTTIDNSLPSGESIPIEFRGSDEIISFNGVTTAPDVPTFSPAFDITPANLITGIITEKGIFTYPYNF
ncbi:MAG TPA: S-methyl-5-thioribose-1-phosphate isomerase [Spirochaetota bacterium]|nr:S-methyl-5-thioribose-1-phosphate isomerase [Spirochaetota bacterium]HOM38572.1 S-methyl-5-thioribose-1-phosphate isomerase [Spirochaetota bacterium]HPQ49709.1 S-methyl-5-thioribose-1-phosphate isomerase [Spirochaetota bacterium]